MDRFCWQKHVFTSLMHSPRLLELTMYRRICFDLQSVVNCLSACDFTVVCANSEI